KRWPVAYTRNKPKEAIPKSPLVAGLTPNNIPESTNAKRKITEPDINTNKLMSALQTQIIFPP
ncbi:MAG: hypothetical protein Q8Q24_02505, partial [bacterium]|nr:hypothetical protein [bacterium]